MLANPWTFTAECLGSQRGLPMSTSPRNPRCWDVRGTTTTSARASRGCGKARTNTGRCFATRPKSTIHTSPGMASILTECVLPLFPLLAGCQKALGKSRDGKGHVVSQLDLRQKNIEGIACLHPEPGKYLFGPLQAIRWNTCAKEDGSSHASKVLKNAQESTIFPDPRASAMNLNNEMESPAAQGRSGEEVTKNRLRIFRVIGDLPPTLCLSTALREPLPLHFPFWAKPFTRRVRRKLPGSLVLSCLRGLLRGESCCWI